MKKILSILLIFCTSFAFTDDKPIFEEADEDECFIHTSILFAADDPLFQEDKEEKVNDEHDQKKNNSVDLSDRDLNEEKEKRKTLGSLCENKRPEIYIGLPIQKSLLEDSGRWSYRQWDRYKSNFGTEKILIRFPCTPTINYGDSCVIAYAYDHTVMYSFTGFSPSYSNLNADSWFQEIIGTLPMCSYELISYNIFQTSNGDWIMDYVAHDHVKEYVIQVRVIVTPFNGYTLQCSKPFGAKDHFKYFLDNFWIKSECHR